MEAYVAVVTETWLRSGPALEEDIDDLLHGSGIGMLTLNRAPGRSGVCHGGVAIAYRDAVMSMSRLCLNNPDDYEVLVSVANLRGLSLIHI